MKRKMTKDVVPEGFTLGMVSSDLLPVIFFGATAFVIGLILNSAMVTVGAVITFISGFLKVLWKLTVVLRKKNVWPLFLQMRIAMPFGFVLFVVGLIVSLAKLPFQTVLAALTGMPQLVFFVLGICGMIAMIIFALKLDSADARANWIEQTTNGIAQACLFLGVLLIYLG